MIDYRTKKQIYRKQQRLACHAATSILLYTAPMSLRWHLA